MILATNSGRKRGGVENGGGTISEIHGRINLKLLIVFQSYKDANLINQT